MWKKCDSRYTALRFCQQFAPTRDALTLLRFGENAVYRLQGSDWVLRINRPTKVLSHLCLELNIMQKLRALSFPCPKPHSQFPRQPIKIGTSWVNVWHWIDHKPTIETDYEQFGRLLHHLHRLTPALASSCTRQFEPFTRIQKRFQLMRTHGVLPKVLLQPMVKKYQTLSQALASFNSLLGVGLLHGDAHSGNVLKTTDQLYLCDFENVSLGPLEYDLAPVAVIQRRFLPNKPVFAAFTHGYGKDLLESPHAQALIELRELNMASWLAQNYGQNVMLDQEIETRIRSIENNTDDQWIAQ